MLFIKVLSAVALSGSIAWCIAEPDYEPAIAMITSLSALVTAFLVEGKRTKREAQKQVVSHNGFGIQAGGNVTTGDIRTEQGTKDAQ
ncbi:hypothetical protein [Pusillimonas sp. NJUB218]|uniref:hypothetical protein n=1 Tax=Pusillimonas sp. NJUB218 TaxID=2023230 RepID=UPI000FF5F3CB|nr:hypothetical protein [Pusillimonas sp. NJUB218]ROT44773.1 hypothetical protein CHR62_10060 [Pusillimonas sp. NJUB218]